MLTALGVVGYEMLGVLSFYLMMKSAAKESRLTSGDVLGCLLFNLVLWPIGAALWLRDAFPDMVLWCIKQMKKPMAPLVKHFNKAYDE